MPSATPYRVSAEIIGAIKQVTASVVHMQRETFLGLVEETFDTDPGYYEPIRAEITNVAQTIKRFPTGEWVHPVRGCGCLVGEYLIATTEIEVLGGMDADAIDLAKRKRVLESKVHAFSLDTLIMKRPHGGVLRRFGLEIDRRVTAHLYKVGFVGDDDTARNRLTVVIDDEEN